MAQGKHSGPAEKGTAQPKHAAPKHAKPGAEGYGTARAEGAESYAQRRASQKRGYVLKAALCFLAAAAVAIGCVLVTQQLLVKPAEEMPPAQEESEKPVEDAKPAVLENDGSIVMTVAGDADTYVKKGESYVEGGCYAHDKTDGVITDKVETSGDVDANTLGDYTVTYTVKDSKDMVATATRTVHVVDDVDGGWDQNGISVLMYHDVYDADNPPAEAATNNNMISTRALDEQLGYLESQKCYYPSWAEIRAYVDGHHSLPARSIAVTFDDGTPGFLNLAIPLLGKHKVQATSFVVCSDGDIQDKLAKATPYVDFQSHSFDMHRAGTVQKGHGGRMYSMSKDEIVQDLDKAVQILQSKDAFAYPYGDTPDEGRAALQEVGYKCAFTTQYGKVKPGDDPLKLPRVRVQGTATIDAFIGESDVAQ